MKNCFVLHGGADERRWEAEVALMNTESLSLARGTQQTSVRSWTVSTRERLLAAKVSLNLTIQHEIVIKCLFHSFIQSVFLQSSPWRLGWGVESAREKFCLCLAKLQTRAYVLSAIRNFDGLQRNKLRHNKNVSVSHEVSIFIIKLLLSIDRFRLSREVKKKLIKFVGHKFLILQSLGSRRHHLTYTESSKLLVLSTRSSFRDSLEFATERNLFLV